MSTIHHAALSVDIDRFSDAKIAQDYVPIAMLNGKRPTVEEIREACRFARAAGMKVFPPCDNTKADGHCAGHDTVFGLDTDGKKSEEC